MAWLSPEQQKQVEKEAQSSGGNYININKLPENKEHRYRALGSAITGWQGWVKIKGERKPIRWELHPDELPDNLEPDLNGKKSLQFFVASLFWDYTNDKFGIMQLTQKTVYDRLGSLQADPDFGGDLTAFDIKVTRKVTGERVSYEVFPAPPKPLAKSIQLAYEDLYCDLRRLYDGEDPFKDPNAFENGTN